MKFKDIEVNKFFRFLPPQKGEGWKISDNMAESYHPFYATYRVEVDPDWEIDEEYYNSVNNRMKLVKLTLPNSQR
jgi:hypothetical protein